MEDAYGKYVFRETANFRDALVIGLIINVVYVDILRLAFLDFHVTTYYAATTFGLIIPTTIGAIILGYMRAQHRLVWHLKQAILAFHSILFAFFISLRSIVCRYG